MRIDVHNHAMPESALALLRKDPRYGVKLTGQQWQGGRHADVEIGDVFYDPQAKLAELESKGLDGAVMSSAPPLFCYHVEIGPAEAMARAMNAGLAEMAAAAPDRLRWMATAPLQDAQRAVAVLEDAASAGAVGVEIGTSADGNRIDHERFAPFWEAAARLNFPVLIHPQYNEPNTSLNDFYLKNVIGNQLETTVAIERLICARVLDRYPDLRFVLSHAGGYFAWQAGRLRHARTVRPELADAPLDPWSYVDRLWFDTITHDEVALRYLASRVGVSQVVMGTDLPFDMASPEPMQALLAATDEGTARTIAETNPATLFGFPT